MNEPDFIHAYSWCGFAILKDEEYVTFDSVEEVTELRDFCQWWLDNFKRSAEIQPKSHRTLEE